MYGKRGSRECSYIILALCGEWWGVVVGGKVPTNNEPVKGTPSKKAKEGACLLHHNRGIGRELIPSTIGVRPCNHRENW